MRLSLDIETYSMVDLRKVTAYKYFESPSTNLWCVAYAFDDDNDIHSEVSLWVPGSPVPGRIVRHVEAGGEIRAWNAAFERLAWWFILGPTYGWPKTTLEQFRCTMADAMAMSLPHALGQAAEALNLTAQKDTEGRKLALKMCKPRSTKGELIWWDDDEHKTRLYSYCKSDVETERGMFNRTRRLIPQEQEMYWLTQRMNDYGVQLDMPLVKAAKKIAVIVRDRAGEMISELTEAAVTKVTQYARLKTWLHDNDVVVTDTAKSTIRELLGDKGIQGPVRRVLEIWAETAKSSIAKIDAMIRMRNADDVVRGLQIYCAASTGRWGGAGFQPHNFPRGQIKDVERFIPMVLAGDIAAIEAEEPPIMVLAELLRRMIKAREGGRLLVADFEQIEARVLSWVSGQEDMVQAYAAGTKIYERMAGWIYGVDPDAIENPSVQRTVGKTAVLGCGYGMGWRKFQEQLFKETGIWLEDAEAEGVIDAYRMRMAMHVDFWTRIESAVRVAILRPGKVLLVGRSGMIRVTKRGKFLWIVLPSGRPLGYCQPAIEVTKTKVGFREQIRYNTRDPMTKKWVRTHTYGGKLTENVVSAMSRDLLAAGMTRTEAAGYPPGLTVHDEIVADVRNGFGSLQQFEELMAVTPPWARTCPVSVKGYEAERYRK